jgi:hypothetical protein
MKNKITNSLLAVIVITTAFVYSGCFEILTVSQPSSAMGGEKITATINVDVQGNVDANPHYGIVGLLVPNDWTVDSVKFSGGYTDYATYLHPDSSDKETGGQVDYWNPALESKYPSGDNYKWVVFQSSKAHAVINDTLETALVVKMTTGVSQGNFNIGYFVTDAALDFSDPSYYSISVNNAINVSGVLPVELTTFSANAAKNGVNLKWETATEKNNKGFEIQRSSDKTNFATIGFVEGKGTSSEKNTYSYLDKNAAQGSVSYRLKQVDFDGTYEFSKTVEVNNSVPDKYVLGTNYPNPFNPVTNIQFGLPVEANVTITLFNTVGEQVKVIANGNYAAGSHLMKLNASDLPSGTYIYTITASGSDGSRFNQSHKMLLMK